MNACSLTLTSAAPEHVEDHVLCPLDGVGRAADDEVLVAGVGRGVLVDLAVGASRLVDLEKVYKM